MADRPVCHRLSSISPGEVAQWQSRGLISPWLPVQIRPSPLEPSNYTLKADRLLLKEPVLHRKRREMSPPELSPETERCVNTLFVPEERHEAAVLLVEQCGNNLPLLANKDKYEMERFRFAALKYSNGNLERLQRAIDFAKRDWRDLLVIVGFAEDLHEHERWFPTQKTG
jgi:hypothetical protein